MLLQLYPSVMLLYNIHNQIESRILCYDDKDFDLHIFIIIGYCDHRVVNKVGMFLVVV